jgi:hypothetical protein
MAKIVPAKPGQKTSRDGARDPPGEVMTAHDHPPFFSSWRKAYWFAILLFAIEVALLYAFTLRFS